MSLPISIPATIAFPSADRRSFGTYREMHRKQTEIGTLHPRKNPKRSISQTIRRIQLRQLVPLADSTIYEMEQRGEFPRRFALSPRCVVWDLAEVEAWLNERRRSAAAAPNAPLPLT